MLLAVASGAEHAGRCRLRWLTTGACSGRPASTAARRSTAEVSMRSRWLIVAGLTVALATPTTVAARSTAPPVAKVHPAAGVAPTAAAAAARWRPTRDT